jgi:hypothetical protein
MINLHSVIKPAAVFSALILVCPASFAEEVTCASNAGRQIVKVMFKAGSLSRSGDTIEVVPACSDAVLTVGKCAIVAVEAKGRQQFCYPAGLPAYADVYDVIEYYAE